MVCNKYCVHVIITWNILVFYLTAGFKSLDVCTQTETAATVDSGVQCDRTSCDCKTLMKARHYEADAEGMHYYTGLESYAKFNFVLSSLGPAASCLDYYYSTAPTIAVEDQLFLTLIKLRRNWEHFELARRFSITEKCVSNIFITWINFMALQWSEIDWWPSRDVVGYYMPTDFQLKFPTTRVIIDGTECPIQKPQLPILQQSSFSSYKNRNTVKVLVGSSPGGLVSYVSPAYGGSTSDRQICERSNLSDMCDPGDSIMSDKGFNVQDMFEHRNITVNIPSFFKKKNRLSQSTVLKDRKIASKRVHIERIIGLGKTFATLRQPMNATHSALASEIIKVCYLLCNFRTGIVSKEA